MRKNRPKKSEKGGKGANEYKEPIHTCAIPAWSIRPQAAASVSISSTTVTAPLSILTDNSWATCAALTTGAYGSILEAKSFRSKRMLRSTLAAEAAAKDAGVDHGTFINAFLSELLTGVRAKDQPLVFQHYSVTDCKSLYDAVRQATPTLTDKRTIIDLTATRESLAKDHLLWVPTYAMLADALTKPVTNESMHKHLSGIGAKIYAGRHSLAPRTEYKSSGVQEEEKDEDESGPESKHINA